MERKKKSFLIIGLGRFGTALCEKLSSLGQNVIGIDSMSGPVMELSDKIAVAAQMDVTDENSLRKIGATQVDVAVVTIGEAVEHSILCTSLLVDMGVPRLLPAQVPFVPEADSEMSKRCEHSADVWTIFCPPLGREIEFTAVGMGNPHATIFVDDVESFPVEPVARFLQTSAVFPEDVNVGFVERIDSRTAKIRVYERGAGETLACGTGTSAAMASGYLRGFFDDRVEFAARGGRIACAWRGPATSLYLIGPAEVVFVGTISLDI